MNKPVAATTGKSALRIYIQRNMYRWHRLIGILTVIPVIFWCLSGLSHPFMSHWFKPTIAREFIRPQAIDANVLIKSPEEVLRLNHIPAFRNIRVVRIGSTTYYQVKGADNQLNYYDTGSGKPLVKGDEQYAESLARYFVDDTRTPVRITPVTVFTNEYRYVNRLLPVWKVSFDRPDGMDVYVETELGASGQLQ